MMMMHVTPGPSSSNVVMTTNTKQQGNENQITNQSLNYLATFSYVNNNEQQFNQSLLFNINYN